MRIPFLILAAWAISYGKPCFAAGPAGESHAVSKRDQLLEDERLVAVSVVDSGTLRYRVLAADSLEAETWVPADRLFFHMRVDSVAEAEPLLREAGGIASLAAVPVDMGTLPVRRKKALFFSILESIARFHNETILSRRKRLLSLQNSASDGLFLQDMAEHYALARSNSALSTRADSLRELLRRVDVIPPSLVLAQGAIESGWGTSRFARQGNNLYGQRVWRSELKGMTASGAQSSRFRLAMYDNIAGSVRSYMRNLNTHPSYEELRSLRAQARAENGPIRGNVLADGLRSYSTRGEEYVADVQRMIRGNALEELDGEER